MSKLGVLRGDFSEEIARIRSEYHDAVHNKQHRDRYPCDAFPAFNFPDGQEDALLRKAVTEARIQEGLSFRFWWAGKHPKGPTSLFVSFPTLEDSERFDEICEKYGAFVPYAELAKR